MRNKILSILMILALSSCNLAFAFKGNSENSVKTKNKKENTEIESCDNTTIVGTIEENIVSLDDCIKFALENSLEIKSAILTKEIYKTKIGQVWAQYFPGVSAGVGYSRLKPMGAHQSMNDFAAPTLQVSQLVYDFGKIQTEAKIAKKEFESTENHLQEVINTIIYDVKAAYYYLLYTIQQEQILAGTVERFEMALNQANAYYSIGKKAKIDVTMAEYNLSNAKLSYIKAKNDISIAFARLNEAMGVHGNDESYKISEKLDFLLYDIDFEKLVEEACEMRPELLAMKKKAEASELLVKASVRAFMPDISLEGSYSSGGENIGKESGYGLGGFVNYPMTNLALLKKRVDEAKLVAKKERTEYHIALHSVHLQVKQAYIQLVNAKQSVPVAKKAMLEAQEQYNLASGRYKTGLSEALELKDAEQTYRNAQLDYYRSLLDYNTSAGNLEKVIGAPLKVIAGSLL